ncbi:MAG: anthranilate synthase component I family protein [Flavobacteriales bacterium]
MLDSHGYHDEWSRFNQLIAAGAHRKLVLHSPEMAFEQLEAFVNEAKLPVIFILSYDLKNAVEQLTSSNNDICQCPYLIAIEPLIVYFTKNGQQHILKQKGVDVTLTIEDSLDQLKYEEYPTKQDAKPFAHMDESSYMQHFQKIKDHIQRGDIYEMNYCISFKRENTPINPIQTYCNLSAQSPAPFSAYFKHENMHVICSSPERFLHKKGNILTSQPIKGTAKRHIYEVEDKLAKQGLLESEKERNENVMIVDLVRNDLSRLAQKAGVFVEELYGVYSFAKVHQMISTIQAKLKKDATFSDILYATFPMGSMTGAPKINAMKFAEEFEDFKRGFYSGSIGYVWPGGDFDMNVVIRSLVYNLDLKSAYIGAGSAITSLAEAQAEYKECLLKAEAIINAIVYDTE